MAIFIGDGKSSLSLPKRLFSEKCFFFLLACYDGASMTTPMTTATWSEQYKRITNRAIKYLEVHKKDHQEEVRELLLRTFQFAERAYEGKLRKNGDTVMDHVQASLEFLFIVKPDVETIQLCLLHELYSHTEVSPADIEEAFGKDMVTLLDKFEGLKKVKLNRESSEEVEKLRQMLVVLADDVRVILVKLATKLHGLETIDVLPRARQRMLAREVLDIYSPISSRLGVYALKTRLEDCAFRILKPKTYKRIEKELQELVEKNKDIIAHCKKELVNMIRRHKMKAEIFGRIKSVYSISKKLKSKHKEHVGELQDIFAMRVLVGSKEDCYRLFGYVHEEFPPLPHRIKDYIALPKANDYQSLHTTVTGIYRKNPHRPVEVQIRTAKMNEVAEYGIASHSAYKEGERKRIGNATLWQKRLATLNKYYSKRGSFTTGAGQNLSETTEQVFVLTPQGDVKSLKQGATPLDFAYHIHTDVGHQCVAAKVNGRVVPLSYTLQTGDEVEIVRRSSHRPTATSLLYVKTSGAKTKLKAYLEEAKREEYLSKGRSMMEKELRQASKPQFDKQYSQLDPLVANKKDPERAKENIFIQVAKGTMKSFTLLKKLYPEARKPLKVKAKKKDAPVKGSKVLKIDHKKGVPYTFAKCCLAKGLTTDIAASSLVGYVTLRDGVKVHSKDCRHMATKHAARLVSVS